MEIFWSAWPLPKTFFNINTAVASAVYHSIVFWGSIITAADRKRPDKLIRKDSSVLG